MPKNKEKIEKTAHIRGLEEEWVPHASRVGIEKLPFSNLKDPTIETLYNTVKHSPEVIACITAIVEDIMADSWKFIGATSAIEKAKKFQAQSNFYKILANTLFDALISGNGYDLKLSVNEEKIKSLISDLTDKLAQTLNVKVEKKKKYEVLKQQKLFGLIGTKPKDLQMLKASTIKINFDETGLPISYEQKVHMQKERVYRPEDIIHLDFLNIGGQPYGFTPLETVLSDIATLIYAKEFAGKYFENDGIPYFLFNMPDATPDDRNYELLKKELKELKKSTNKYRTLVTTGNVTAEQINKFNKDMEFPKLIEHFTQLVLMAYGVPPHRVNMTVHIKDSASELGKIEAGYYKKIGFMQKIIENVYNKNLWNHFNVEMKFNRAYKIDEMREAQIAQILSQIGAVTIEEIRERIGMDPEIPKGTMPKVTGDQNNINFRADKLRERGQEKPVGKPTDNKLKTKSFEGIVEVSYGSFVAIVEQQMGTGNFDQAKILYNETAKEFVLYFSDGIWRYKTVVDKTSINEEVFRYEKLRNAMKINQNMVEIPFEELVKVVEQKMGEGNFNNAKILYNETDTEFILHFSDGIWQYRSKLPKAGLDIDAFRTEKLGNAVRIFP